MIFSLFIIRSFSLTLLPALRTQAYCLKDSFKGQDFLNNWDWQTFDDPTHGRVNFVDKDLAQQSNLSYGKTFSQALQL
jgi:hypothetical protein